MSVAGDSGGVVRAGTARDAPCSVCETNAAATRCTDCDILFCVRCFDAVHKSVAAVRDHKRVDLPVPVAENASKPPLVNGPKTEIDNVMHNAMDKDPQPTTLVASPSSIIEILDDEVLDVQHDAPSAKRTRRDSNASARPRSLARTTPPVAAGLFTTPTPPPLDRSRSLPIQGGPMMGVPMPNASPTHVPPPMTFHMPPTAMPFQPPPDFSHQHPPPSHQPPPAAAPLADDTALEDLFFDRFNGVNDQVDTLETQLADALTTMSTANVNLVATAAQRIAVIKQSLQVMYSEREQALAKVVVHSPELFRRTRALQVPNLQNVPELWPRAYQKLRQMATHLKKSLENLQTLQFHVSEQESQYDLTRTETLRTLYQNVQSNRVYIAQLRRDRYDECISLITFCQPLRVKVRDEFKDVRRQGVTPAGLS
ncbi:Aste57867_17174 [Aphanomyces stellatus]|uniref:Aste57867_17174 protein n=1 Tax=Aphanomyces stellatus TaxID=120398 RepID=A0A485L7X8_9STRA|nr:hypothetical protein As57867_017115 [Aphanomyces stellatus]VFT93931.1 Aste57867_17174 [Aphanomyces stellatus]